MMKTIHYISLFLLLCCVSAGCDDFTETDLPPTKLYSDYVFEDRATAMAAMADVFARMRDNGLLSGTSTGMTHQLGLYADEFDYFGTISDPIAYYQNALLPSTSAVGSWWNESYKQVYAANAIIEGVGNSTSLAQADKDQLQGEALFVRAFVHLNLTMLFGDIPYIASTDYQANSVVSRQPQADVFDRIVADLELAAQKLPADYTDADRIRPNRFAAHALLARAYLNAGRWAEAANAASAVLNETAMYAPETDLNAVFLKDATTTIWQFKPRSEGRNTDEAVTLIFTQVPPPGPALRNSLMDAFESGDQRSVLWTQAVTDGTATYYRANKYKENTNTGTSVEYSIVLRLAEQYLIRAEARARQGEVIGAKEDLDVVRGWAGLEPTAAITQQGVLDAILQEWRVEFFAEFGNRFMTLQRFGALDLALGNKPGWNTTDRLLPLPERELVLNPNLAPQNPGY